ncbi:MAG: uracil-DNA glycosylase family protein [Chloroflexota bacterium]|nr:uracil-DNA glycosylase family protein [Chloroflexota bacterium]
MNIDDHVRCIDFPCQDVVKECYQIPDVAIDPSGITMVMISEVSPLDPQEYFYAPNNPFYLQTTLQSFNDAGLNPSSITDILDLGIYITTAVKCGKAGYSISSDTISNCSGLLERELELFPNIKVIMLMGDVAIKSMNLIARRQLGDRVIPAGSTYKIRKNPYYYKNTRVFPSYIITGKNFLIEKSKRSMIAEDIGEAIKLLR